MGAVFLAFVVILILAWKVLNFTIAGAIYMFNKGRFSMAWCEDTARGILGGIVATFVLLAILL